MYAVIEVRGNSVRGLHLFNDRRIAYFGLQGIVKETEPDTSDATIEAAVKECGDIVVGDGYACFREVKAPHKEL